MTQTNFSTYSSQSEIPTENGSRYLQQLCKHWSHNLDVEYDTHAARVIFPAKIRGADWKGDAMLILTATETQLECQLNASEAAQLEGLKDVVQRHLDRFAFREAPLPFDWKDNASA